MNNLLITMLRNILDRLESGNSNINEFEVNKIIEILNNASSTEMSTTEVYRYLGVSRDEFYKKYRMKLKGKRKPYSKITVYNRSEVEKLKQQIG